MITTKITMTHESTATMIGQHRNANRKEVLCLDTGILYTSVTDAAQAVGVTEGAISQNLTGLTKKCTGKRFCYAKEAKEHLGDISASMQEKNELLAEALKKLAVLEEENEHLRNENAELQICVDSAQGNLDWHADVVAKCHEQMSHMEQLIANLRQELQEYKDREEKRERIKALRAELAELEKEEI